MTMIGRKNEIEEMLDGDIPYPENKAFFGVKGVGKSTLMETLFSMPNCKKFAKEYKALYVRDNIPENLNGEDLTELLLYIVTKGVDLIDDELIKDDITQQIIKISKRFDRKDHQLNYALNIIKESKPLAVAIRCALFNVLSSRSGAAVDGLMPIQIKGCSPRVPST